MRSPAFDHRQPSLTRCFAIRGLLIMLTATLFASCGGDAEKPSRPAAASPTATPQIAGTPTPAASPTGADITAAEQAVKRELPDLPHWQGARFRGKTTAVSEVCVDRTITRESADAIGGERTSHVVVALPGLSAGEPQDGPCAKADENADKAIEASRRFFERVDDDAIALDEVVAAVQNDEPGATERLASVRNRIAKRVSSHLLKTGETSVGGNLLVSAATTARTAARSSDVAQLADVRRDIADARGKLAEEVVR